MNSHNPCGSGWIGMVGEMVMINVGLNDQVRCLKCAILYFRGLCPSVLNKHYYVELNLVNLCV